ncbi:hypothetical protein HID58_071138, partial [Brassica napus]
IPWDKKMLSIGGHTKDPSESTQVKVFDTHTCTWSMLETYGKPPVSRGGQSVTVVGKTLVIFGRSDHAAAVHAERYLILYLAGVHMLCVMCFDDLHVLDLQTHNKVRQQLPDLDMLA